MIDTLQPFKNVYRYAYSIFTKPLLLEVFPVITKVLKRDVNFYKTTHFFQEL